MKIADNLYLYFGGKKALFQAEDGKIITNPELQKAMEIYVEQVRPAMEKFMLDNIIITTRPLKYIPKIDYQWTEADVIRRQR